MLKCILVFHIGSLDVCNYTLFKPAAKTILDLSQFLGWAITGNYDLFHGLVQRIEGMEEFFLSAFLLGQKLNVVNQEHVHCAELVAETGHLVVAQRVDHLIGEFLAGDVTDCRLRLTPFDLMTDGLHEVRLAHTNTPIQEERVVSLGRTLRHRLTCRVSELVAAADNEGIKGIARIQLRSAIPIETRLGSVSRNRHRSRKAAIVAHWS